jgi:hypothetical protein
MGKSWMWWYTPIIPVMVGSINETTVIQDSLGEKKETFSPK